MPEMHPLLMSLAAALLLMVGVWLVSLAKRDVSIVDSFWSLLFLLMATVYALGADELALRGEIVMALVAVWALRLAGHITWRNHGSPEDPRYVAMRAKHEPGFAWKSLYIVFLLQGTIAWVVAIPLFYAITTLSGWGPLDYLATLLVLFGIAYESIADAQLAAFKADPDNRGHVMDRGLWRYSRHPNYFGECCVWWGFYLFALATGAWWTVFAPLLMTFLLVRVSGVSLLEKDISDRRPAYRDYKLRTNALIPGAPRTVRKVMVSR